MLSRIPSVKDTYFQHKVLTKIHGQPVYETLQNLATELKANAGSVPSTLGGGENGHLGLILSDIRYAALPNTVAWATPTNPGAFVPPAGSTGPQIEAAKEVWRDRKQTFEICQATEKALIAQSVEAIDSIYLRALLNRATGQYSTSIRSMILHLFTTYGKITPQQVKEKEVELFHMHFEIIQPIDTVFNAIEDLADLAEHATSPMSSQQMIDLAYVILAKQTILQQDLRSWSRLPAANRTWTAMVDHFRTAQAELNALPTAGNIYHQHSTHHQANSTIAIADLVAQRLIDVLQPEEPNHELANSLQRRENELQTREAALLQQMQEMMHLMRTPTPPAQPSPHHGGRSGNRNRGGRQNERGRGRTVPNTNTRTNSARTYCWTHGACAHTGATCNTPSDGHQVTATFNNMLGGSTSGCYWITA